MEPTCVCCNKTKDKISRILYSKDECELQVIFYYKLPTEMIRTIGEYLYQPELIQINHRIKRRNQIWLQYVNENRPEEDFDEIYDSIIEDKTTYNCSSCFLYNFIKFRQQNPNKMPRLRNDVDWFKNSLETKGTISTFKDYFGDIFKFELPVRYNMYFYRSLGLIIVKKNGEAIKENHETAGFCKSIQKQYNYKKIFNNDEIIKIIIPTK